MTAPRSTHDLFAYAETLSPSHRERVERAYLFAQNAHEGQKRASGEPYINHLVATAETLIELNVDTTTVMAGLLHDTVEDTSVTEEELRGIFGDEVVTLVRGTTKLGKLKYHGLKRHVENLRKLFVAMANDIRVILIKLADRLHNMQTIAHLPKEKRRRIALETLEIYAPIAHRLGIGRMKGVLEDLAFSTLYPKEYARVEELLLERSREQKVHLTKVANTLKRKLAKDDITDLTTDYRTKHRWSLYKKLQRCEMNIEKVYDIAALRIIVPSVEDCYRTLGIIHQTWKPLPKRIKDYIATPKPNGYRSLHTTVFTGDGAIVEIQIRTPDMHHEAEFGIASHASYKESMGDETAGRWILDFFSNNKSEGGQQNQKTDDIRGWVERLASTQQTIESPQTFIKNLRSDFFNEHLFVFTPHGEVIDLPDGSTPLDFAYALHTDVGNHAAGAKVNGKFVSLGTKLRGGDIVAIETKQSAHPSEKWLRQTKTTLAKRKIRAALQKQNT